MRFSVTNRIIEKKIYLIRGHKVLLDRDLAELYVVETKRLNEQVRRNLKRFPDDFMFQLTEEEAESLRDLENTKIPFIMSPYYKIGGIEYEDIDPDSEWSIPTNGGLDFSFG